MPSDDRGGQRNTSGPDQLAGTRHAASNDCFAAFCGPPLPSLRGWNGTDLQRMADGVALRFSWSSRWSLPGPRGNAVRPLRRGTGGHTAFTMRPRRPAARGLGRRPCRAHRAHGPRSRPDRPRRGERLPVDGGGEPPRRPRPRPCCVSKQSRRAQVGPTWGTGRANKEPKQAVNTRPSSAAVAARPAQERRTSPEPGRRGWR